MPNAVRERLYTDFQDLYFRDPKFHRVKREKPKPERLHIGVELEMEAVDGDDMHLAGILDAVIEDNKYNPDLWIYKGDGSLTNGAECVTQPFTWQYYRSQMKLGPVFDQFKAHGRPYTKHGRYSAGIHVHMSKAAFTDAHFYRFAKFHADNESFCRSTVGRDANQYNSFDGLRSGGYRYNPLTYRTRRTTADEKLRFGLRNPGSFGGHFSAVNNDNARTIELRYFRSTQNEKRFRAIIEWVFALFYFTKVNRPLTPDAFKEFVYKHSIKYPHLIMALNNDPAVAAERFPTRAR